MKNIGEGNGNPLQYSCLENSMGRGAWWAAVHGVTKSRTWLSDFTFTFHFHALEKEMVAHSSVLAWRIPEMVETGGLPSMGLHRVGHNWSDLAAAAWKIYMPHGVGNDCPLQYSCLGKSMDGRAWWVVVHGVTWGHMTEHTCMRGSEGDGLVAINSSPNVSIVTIREYLKCTLHRVRKMVSPKMLWAVITIVNHRVIPEFSGNSGFTFEAKSIHFSKPQLSHLWHGRYLPSMLLVKWSDDVCKTAQYICLVTGNWNDYIHPGGAHISLLVPPSNASFFLLTWDHSLATFSQKMWLFVLNSVYRGLPLWLSW